MRAFAINLMALIFTLNSTFLPVAQANPAMPSNLQQLVNVRNKLIEAQNDLNKYGYVSKTTLIGLSGVAVGLGAFAAGSGAFHMTTASYDTWVKIGNAGHGSGILIASGSSVLSSLAQQVKELLGTNVRSDLDSNTKNLISIMDSALASSELSPEQAQKILVLKKSFSNKSLKLSRNPWYIKTLNFVEGAVTLLGLLLVAMTVISGHPGGVVGAGFLLVPVSAITVLLRAADETYEIYTQKKFISDSIGYLDKLIEADKIKNVIIVP
jgi:hypothetical protein